MVESRTIISVYMITSEVCVCVITLVDTGGVRVKIGGDGEKTGDLEMYLKIQGAIDVR